MASLDGMGDVTAATRGPRRALVAAEGAGFRLRPMTPDDDPFLHELYADLQTPDLSLLGWEPTRTAALVDLQFSARQVAYRDEHPDAEDWAVVVEGDVAGRLLWARRPTGHRVVDIALLTRHRGHGIGTALMTEVLGVAAGAGVAVELAVEAGNDHLVRWYERLGFGVVSRGAVHLGMAWAPPGGC